MISIVPTILTDKVENFSQFAKYFQTFTKRIQLDISDGQFTPNPTINLKSITFPENWDGDWDIHLMVKMPSLYLEDILLLKPRLCILHAECDENLLPIFKKLSEASIKTGVAIQKPTYPGDIKPYIEASDHVLIFGGTLGQQGGEANLLQLEKASIIRSIDPKVEIGWDGGVNLDNIRMIAHSDIDVINVGSAITNAKDPKIAYGNLLAEAEKTGVNI